jgi:uncharacterized hydrophobic protein (TIGR00271 family)
LSTENDQKNRESLNISFRYFRKSIGKFLGGIFSVNDEIDYENTSKSIESDIAFRGFNIWILIFSIIICSIGLNLNSTAVVIGAMLISPLMGPINGIGFAMGTFDRNMLMRGIKNFLIALIISILTSAIFFRLAPIGEYQSELLSRTKPIFLDLVVALFGGLAGILGACRKIKTNVIPGVAIATALMPPLCTAGFGIATGNWAYFLGAFYLFFINSVFISIAALVVVRYLRFPIKTYLDKRMQKRAKWVIWIFALVVSIPSILIYRNVLKESRYKATMNAFLKEHIEENGYSMPSPPQFFFSDSINVTTIYVYSDELTKEKEDSIAALLVDYGLNNMVLDIHNMGSTDVFKDLVKNKDSKIQETQLISESLQKQLAEKSDKIDALEKELAAIEASQIDIKQLSKEVKTLFPQSDTLLYSILRDSDTSPWQGRLVLRTTSRMNTRTQMQIKEFLTVRFAGLLKPEDIFFVLK